MLQKTILNIKNKLITTINGIDFQVADTLEKYLYDFNVIKISDKEFLDFDLFINNNPLIQNNIENQENLSNHEKYIENFKNNERITLLVIDGYNSSEDITDKIINNLLSIRTNFSPNSRNIKTRFLLLSDFSYEEKSKKFNSDYGSWPFTMNDNHYYSSNLKIGYFDLHKFNKTYDIILESSSWTILYNYTRGYIFDIEFLINDIVDISLLSIDKIENICLPYYTIKEKKLIKLIQKIKIKDTLFSIKTMDKNLIDEINRSGIFKESHTVSHASIFKPKNYFSEFCLNRYLYDKKHTNMCNYPAKHTLEEHVDLFQTITRYERFFKNKLISINQNNYNILEDVIFRLKSHKEDQVVLQPEVALDYESPLTINKDLKNQTIKEWGSDETRIDNIFDGLTFGELKIIYQKLTTKPDAGTIYKIKKEDNILNLLDYFFNNAVLLSHHESESLDKISSDIAENISPAIKKSKTDNRQKVEFILNPLNKNILPKSSKFLCTSNFSSKISIENYIEEKADTINCLNIIKEKLSKMQFAYIETKQIIIKYYHEKEGGETAAPTVYKGMLFKCTFIIDDSKAQDKVEAIDKSLSPNTKKYHYEKHFILKSDGDKNIREMLNNSKRNDEQSENQKLIPNKLILMDDNDGIQDDINFLSELRLYRNAISHNKKLSKDSIEKFYKISKDYIELTSNEPI